MKILFLCNSLIGGGAEKLLSELLPRFVQEGMECDLLLLSNENEKYYSSINEGGANIYIVPKNKKTHLSKIFYIKHFIENGKYDLIHANLFPMFYYASLAKMFSFKKNFPILCMTEHSTSNKRRKYGALRLVEKLVYSKYKRIICISDGTRASLEKWLKSKAISKNIVTINNGIDVDYIVSTKSIGKNEIIVSNCQNSILLCMVGSFTKQKNHSFALEVLSKLPNNYYLLLLGEGELKNNILNLIESLGLDNRVFVFGFQSNPYQYIKASDIMIIPSLWEGFGLVAAEGMACQKPIVCSNVDGLRDVVGSAGITCDLNVEEFKNAILYLSGNNVCEKFVVDIAEVEKKYSINTMTKGYLSLFSELIDNK